MYNFLGQLWTNPQFFALVVSAVGAVGGWVWSQVSSGNKVAVEDRLTTIERWARKAAATIAPLVGSLPSSLTATLESKLGDELRAVFSRVGLTLTNDEWAHALEVAHEYLMSLQLQGLGTAIAAMRADPTIASIVKPSTPSIATSAP